MIVKRKVFTDERGGDLLPIEFNSLPFIPKRVFSVSNVPAGSIRGEHAHFETQQILFCVSGEILVGIDYGSHKTETLLKMGDSILVDKMAWDWQKFMTGNEFMFVLCSTNYDKSDYIEDLSLFYSFVKK